MRKMQMFTIQDVRAEAFMRPFFMENEQTAVRAVGTMLVEQKDDLSKFPEDYALWRIGMFCTIHGTVTALDAPEYIGNLANIQKDMMRRIDERISQLNNKEKGDEDNG